MPEIYQRKVAILARTLAPLNQEPAVRAFLIANCGFPEASLGQGAPQQLIANPQLGPVATLYTLDMDRDAWIPWRDQTQLIGATDVYTRVLVEWESWAPDVPISFAEVQRRVLEAPQLITQLPAQLVQQVLGRLLRLRARGVDLSTVHVREQDLQIYKSITDQVAWLRGNRGLESWRADVD